MTELNKENAKEFLRWMEVTEKTTQEKRKAFEDILESIDTDPTATFITGLKQCKKVFEELEDPLSRMLMSPERHFKMGMLFGYCMTVASSDPAFSSLIEQLKEHKVNVTPISAAKGFGK